MAKILAVNISEKKGTVKKPVPEALLVSDFGLRGDAHGGNWHRQISLLAQESVELSKAGVKDKALAKGICEGVFAENITTEGIELHTLPVGTKLCLGSEAVIEITQIGKECHTGCEISKIVGQCIMPRHGVFAKVLRGGVIRPGDTIIIAP